MTRKVSETKFAGELNCRHTVTEQVEDHRRPSRLVGYGFAASGCHPRNSCFCAFSPSSWC